MIKDQPENRHEDRKRKKKSNENFPNKEKISFSHLTSGLYGTKIALVKFPAIPEEM